MITTIIIIISRVPRPSSASPTTRIRISVYTCLEEKLVSGWISCRYTRANAITTVGLGKCPSTSRTTPYSYLRRDAPRNIETTEFFSD